MGLESTILTYGGANVIHLATQALVLIRVPC